MTSEQRHGDSGHITSHRITAIVQCLFCIINTNTSHSVDELFQTLTELMTSPQAARPLTIYGSNVD